MRENKLTERELLGVLEKVKDTFAQESNVIHMDGPITFVGDLHGQFFDMLEIFETAGQVPDTKYVFMGDYVDRGHHGVEIVSYLFLLKLLYPTRIVILRGNHESASVSNKHGFYLECESKYGSTIVWKEIVETFNYLPLVCIVNNGIMAVHAGLSPHVSTLDEIRCKVDRFMDIPCLPGKFPLKDLMWSDPLDCIENWAESQRGDDIYYFGTRVSKQWNYLNKLFLIVRSH